MGAPLRAVVGFSALVVVLAVVLSASGPRRVSIPPHMTGHPSLFEENLLTPEIGDALLSLAKEMKEFPTNTAELKVIPTIHTCSMSNLH